MSAARSSHGGEEPRRREKKEKDKDKEKDAEKKEKSHHIKRSTTKELTESLKPSSEQAERRVSPRSSAARSSGAGEARSSSGSVENGKDGKKSPSNSDKGHKHGGESKLRERRVIRIQALVRQRQAAKVAANLSKEHKARTSIVMEILSTERTYVDILRQVVDLFITPLRESPTPLISSKDIRAIFLTNELLHSCHSALLSQLEIRVAQWGPSQVIGDILLQLLQFLGVYTSYAVFYSQAIQRLTECKKSKAFAEWVDETLKRVVLPKGKVVDLPSLLITPVQRITRYSLLFMDLLKHTTIDHRDYNNLSAAFTQVKLAVETIETSTEEVQAMEQTRYIMDNLILKKGMTVPPAPLRRWLREGYVKLLSARHKSKLKRRWMILFSDVLLLTEKEERKGGDEKKKSKSADGRDSPENANRSSQFRVRKIIPIDQILLRDGRLREIVIEEHRHVIEIIHVEHNRPVVLVLDSPEERRSWYDDLATAIELFQHRTTEEEMEILRQSEARTKALRAAVFSSPTVAEMADPLSASRSPAANKSPGSSAIGSPIPVQFPLSPELTDSAGAQKPSIYAPVRRSARAQDDKRTSISALTLASLSPVEERRASSARLSSDPQLNSPPPASSGSTSGSQISNAPPRANPKKRLSLDKKALSKLNHGV